MELCHAEAVERGDDDRDGHAGEERHDQRQRLGDAGIVSRSERDRLQQGGCNSRTEAEHTADGKEVGLDRNDHNKEQKKDDVQRVFQQRILQLLRVHFLRIRHFLNLFIHIAQPDA